MKARCDWIHSLFQLRIETRFKICIEVFFRGDTTPQRPSQIGKRKLSRIISDINIARAQISEGLFDPEVLSGDAKTFAIAYESYKTENRMLDFQDVSETDFRFLRQLGENLFAVGDDDQTIYSFRSGAGTVRQDFAKQADLYEVTENFRSTPEIVDAAKSIIEGSRERFSKDLNLPVNR